MTFSKTPDKRNYILINAIGKEVYPFPLTFNHGVFLSQTIKFFSQKTPQEIYLKTEQGFKKAFHYAKIQIFKDTTIKLIF